MLKRWLVVFACTVRILRFSVLVTGSRVGVLFLWAVVVLMCSMVPSGCTSTLPGPERFLLERRGDVAESRRLELVGELELQDLARMLDRVYGIQLVFPAGQAARRVLLPGPMGEAEFRRWLEAATESQLIVAGGVWNLVYGAEEFQLLVPGVVTGGFRDVRVDAVGGRFLASGPMRALPGLRRVLDELVRPRGVVRLRVVVVDDRVSGSFGVSVDSGFVLQWDRGFVSSWSPSVVLTALRESGRVVREFDGLLTDGVLFEYEDTVEVRLERFVSGQSGRVFTSEFEVVSSGLVVKVSPVSLGRFWRLTGEVEVSDFVTGGSSSSSGLGGSGAPGRVERRMGYDIDASLGSVIRLARVSELRDSAAFGLGGNAPRLSGASRLGTFSVWLAIERVEPVGPSPVVGIGS